ncbi:MAG: helix-turn-helix domain-containing protein [Porphyrobacter sp.]|nr:helix-turn-helix domain-containing protein [Porphyrobacter sp.]
MDGHQFADGITRPDFSAEEEDADFALPRFIPAAAASSVAGRPKSLPALLRDLRYEAGMTLAELAIKIGVSKPTVWAWEKGRSRPAPAKWDDIARALGVTRYDLALAARMEHRGRTGAILSRHEENDRAALLAAGRQIIATAFNVEPSSVRISVDV